MSAKPFSKATKLFRQGKYEQLISQLEPQVFRYRESFYFYYLLGFSCLHVGDYGSAYTYLQRGSDLHSGDIDTLLGLAAVHLKRQETQEALELWLEILDKDPKNVYAQRGMKLLKKGMEPELLIEFTESGKISRLIPGPAKQVNRSALLALLLLFGLAAAGLLFFPGSPAYLFSSPGRTDLPDISLEDTAQLLSEDGSDSLYQLEEGDIRGICKKLETYFVEGRDNLVQREINRLELSNASVEVKEKTRLLKEYLKTPSFASFEDNFTYHEVIGVPRLYDSCFVLWTGAVSNLQLGEKKIRFDLLVGYERGEVVEGIVPVELDFSAKIDPKQAIEVLASVHPTAESGTVLLRAVSIHQFIQE